MPNTPQQIQRRGEQENTRLCLFVCFRVLPFVVADKAFRTKPHDGKGIHRIPVTLAGSHCARGTTGGTYDQLRPRPPSRQSRPRVLHSSRPFTPRHSSSLRTPAAAITSAQTPLPINSSKLLAPTWASANRGRPRRRRCGRPTSPLIPARGLVEGGLLSELWPLANTQIQIQTHTH